MENRKNAKASLTTNLFFILILSFVQGASAATYKVRFIPFDDIKPSGSNLTVCWGGLGIDRHQRVYFAASDENDVNPDDTVIFRYNAKTGDRELLGSLRGISAAEGNLGPEESIGKVHVAIAEHEGKMYFSSHDFHDIKPDYSDMYERRGGHFYAFDLKTETFEDLSKTDNHGVSVPYQGIIAMDILRDRDQLAGFTFPYGDVLIYDLKKRRTTFYPGVPEYRRNNVARVIWATKKGKVYFSHGTPDFWLWELDVKTGVMKRTTERNVLSHGFLHGRVATRDGNTVYVVTNTAGNLYAFDVEAEHLKDLGSLLPPEEIAEGQSIRFVFGLTLSQDQKKLYTLPCQFAAGNVPTLYEYDIETGKKTQLARFPSLTGGTITGTSVIDDLGRLYFGYHTYQEGEQAQLIQIYRE
jgi:hypothetical protein